MSNKVSALKLSIPTWMYALCAYGLLLPLLLLLGAIIWGYEVSGVLYLCTDSLGIFDCVPPFVHPQHGDVYYTAPWKVYAVWFASVAVLLVAPMSVFWVLSRLWHEDEAANT